ncbi:hypothetical protein ACAH01_12355 [Halomicrobium sp. HM KBTZ05]|uniref:hypothetical protein n=1 Tax=Halomicrobium sp. HM KBTZ05 TaxID=3242663 RepID=UPI003558B469
MDDYRAKNYTHIPLPLDQKYVNTETGEVHDLAPQQIIHPDASVFTAISHLRGDPFLLVDHRYWYGVEDGEIKWSGRNTDFDRKLGRIISTRHHDPETKRDIANVVRSQGHVGIITLADINSRAAKESIYPVIAELESVFAEKIEEELDEIDIVPYLSSKTIDRWSEAKEEGLGMHISEFMELSEILSVVGDHETLRAKFDYNSKTEFEETGGLVHLRNPIMHLSRTLVHNREDLQQTVDRIERCKDIIERADRDVILENYSHDPWLSEFPD